MRGRNPDNPSDRRKGCPTEQRIEIGGVVLNCLTTVSKDTLVFCKVVYEKGGENELDDCERTNRNGKRSSKHRKGC